MLDCQQSKGAVSKEGDVPPAIPDSPEDSCQHCQGSGESPVYWGIQLDDDLLETITNLYPEWFKNCTPVSSNSNSVAGQNGMASRTNGTNRRDVTLPLLSAVKAMGTASSDNLTILTSTTTPSSSSASPVATTNASTSSFSSSSSNSSSYSSSSSLLSSPSNRPAALVAARSSPPKCQVDEASLQKAMDKNKESLKVKLMMRRPITQLVEQGIMPPLKTPPAFHEQRQKLERAKTGDLLKNKIQRRPDRQELIQNHILEDTTVDPSLQDKQRQLKKARLADDLNDRLSHRPGPLELVKGNILHADEIFAQAIKEGQIPFKPTCEGQLQKHPPPRFTIEEDSGSDGAVSPPQDLNDQSQNSLPSVFDGPEPVLIQPQPQQQLAQVRGESVSPPSLSVFLPSLSASAQVCPPSSQTTTVTGATFLTVSQPPGPAPGIQWPSVSLVSSVPTPQTSILNNVASSIAQSTAPTFSSISISTPSSIGAVGKESTTASSSSNKPRKKSKSKAQPKARTIKFHEYKGPPSAQKNQAASTSNAETSYELLLQQQQLFLQWHLELQRNFPQMILPATQKPHQGGNQSEEQMLQQQGFGSFNLSSAGGTTNIISVPTSVAAASNISMSSPPHHSTPQHIQPNQTPQQVVVEVNSPSPRMVTRLEDMKVSDLKLELKKRNLPVSGSKPQLITRLRPFKEFATPAVSTIKSESNTSVSNTNATITATLQPQQQQQQQHSVPVNVGGIILDTVAPTITAVHPSVTLMDNTQTVGVVVGNSGESLGELFVTKHSPVSPPSHDIGQLLDQANNTGHKDSRPPSVVPMEIDANSDNAMDSMDVTIGNNSNVLNHSEASNNATSIAILTNEDIVRMQQKKIEELQRQLQQSQMQLQQQQLFQLPTVTSTIPPPPPPPPPPPMPPAPSILQMPVVTLVTSQVQSQPQITVTTASPALHRQILQQHLHQKLQNSTSTTPNVITTTTTKAGTTTILPAPTLSSAAVKASLAAFLHNQHTPANQNSTENAKTRQVPNGVNHHRAASLPTIHVVQEGSPKPSTTPPDSNSTDSFVEGRPPPPDYDEATKQLNKHQFAVGVMNHISGARVHGKKYIKSQAVDDVLEILIKNGELPPSAAQEPPTPTTPDSAGGKTGNNTTQPPVFPDPKTTTPTSTNTQTTSSTEASSSSVTTSTTSTITSNPNPSTSSTLVSSNMANGSLPNVNSPVSNPGTPAPPPPSLLISDQNNMATNETLDFDFHLDLDDMEAMDLGAVLMNNQENEPGMSKDLNSINMGGTNDMNSHHPLNTSSQSNSNNQHQQSTLPPSIGDLVGNLQDTNVSMDMELSDWLDVIIPTSSSSGSNLTLNCNNGFGTSFSSNSLSNNNSNNNNNSYNLGSGSSGGGTSLLHGYTNNHEHDPLLSNLGQQSNDPFDLFAVEDMDFKSPTELSVLSWDKVDFATT